MNWLTLELIHKHCRIDDNDEDELLTLYGESAEETVENIIGKSYNDMLEEYGAVPKAIIQAGLMLVENARTNRSPVTPMSMYTVPYGFETIVKPYMKLNA